MEIHIDGLGSIYGRHGVGHMNLEGRMLLENSQQKELCKGIEGQREQYNIRTGRNEKKNDFVLRRKEHRRFVQHLKAITEELQHVLVVAGINKRKIIRKVVRIIHIEIRQISLLIDKKIKK